MRWGGAVAGLIVVCTAAAARADGAVFTLRDDKGNVVVDRATVAAWSVTPRMTDLTLESAADCATLAKVIQGKVQSRNQGAAMIEYTTADADGKERVTATEKLVAASWRQVTLVLDGTGFHCDTQFETSTTQKLTKRIKRSSTPRAKIVVGDVSVPPPAPVDAAYVTFTPGYARTKVQYASTNWDSERGGGLWNSGFSFVLAASDPALLRLKAANTHFSGALDFVHTNADGTTTTAIEVTQTNAFVAAAEPNASSTFSTRIACDYSTLTIPL